MLDLLIRGGMVVDGSGEPARRADVAIGGETIEAVGNLEGAQAVRVVEATGLVVSPGFVDTHVHSDVMLLADPQHAPKLCQGITTEILGQDGLSYAPLSRANLEINRRYLAGANGNPDIAWDWSTVAEFRARFDRTVAINTAFLIPHGGVRLEVLGMRNTPMRGDDLERARSLVEQGMEDGAVGMSTGLSYFPGAYSDTEELIELCRPVAAHGGVYVTHLRSVFQGEPFDPVQEAIAIGRGSGVAVHFSHFRTAPGTHGRAAEILAPIEAARAAGADLSLEAYPYPSGSGFAVMFLPPWAHEGGPEEIRARLVDPTQRPHIVADMVDVISRWEGYGWEDLAYTHVRSARNRGVVGLNFVEAARQRGSASAEETICDLLLEEDLEVGFVMLPPAADIWEAINRDLVYLFSRPYYMVGSDSIPVGDKPHPRAYGTFPRLLGRFRRQYGMPLEALVNRAAAVPAQRFRLRDRGLIQPGKAADVVIFNPDTLSDTATYENPRSFPTGIEYVLVNGRVAVEGGKPSGVLAGRALAPSH